jgi:hypothetical protein
MKKFILLLVIFTSLGTNAARINLHKMTVVEDYDGVFTLSSHEHQKSARLDCQSFIHKLDFFNEHNQLTHENYISTKECEDIYHNINNCLGLEQIKCFDTQDIFSLDCQCQ